ncbi:MAG TPA: DUF4168 domain-containing protein [Balneolaceae bacterium]|nr:DUF4168 domain-containing protein [Balneolaceae bacterium]
MKFKITTLLLLFMTLCTGLLTAQVPPMNQQMPDLPTSADVSDEELSQLASTIEQLEPIQLEAESKIAETLESEGITIERFQQMMMAMQNPQMADQVNITEDEMQKVQQIQPDLMEIQGEAEQKITEKIEDNGFTMDRYRAIIMGLQQDAELLERLQNELGISPQQ